MKRKGRTMSQKEFEKICKNVMDYEKIKNITITGFGEPLIDKEIDKKIEWLNNNYPKVDIDIYTNASLLSQDVSEKLLRLKLHKINFSINGTEKSYNEIMGLNYDKTKENILYFLKKKKERGLNYPLTNISLMIIKENEKEIEEVVSFWKDKTDSIMTYMPSDWAGSLKSVSFVAKNPFKPKRWPCKVLWDSVTVDVDGNVIMCCRDYESVVKFGSLLKHNINEIRQSEKFRALRESQSKYDFSSQICSTCDNCFDSSLNWWGKLMEKRFA
jgi:radical SAM protein with 4Fe4S-binding SPASM domain